MSKRQLALRTDESGQDMAEYAILLALIAMMVVLAIGSLAPQIGNSFNGSASAISSAGVAGVGAGSGTSGGSGGGNGDGNGSGNGNGTGLGNGGPCCD